MRFLLSFLSCLPTAHLFGNPSKGASAALGSQVPDVVEDPSWFIASAGSCRNMTFTEEKVRLGSEDDRDKEGEFVGYLSFDYYPKKSMSFTDYPFHLSSVIGETNQVKAIENDGHTRVLPW